MARAAVNEGSGRASSPEERLPPPEAGSDLRGVNVVGYLSAEAGIGESARKVLAAVDEAGIPRTVVNYAKLSPSRQLHPLEPPDGTAVEYPTNIVCLNAGELPRFAYDVGPEFFAARYTIGVWWWELPVFPKPFHRAFRLVDEIWVGSGFVAEAIRAETPTPVHIIPLAVDEPPPSTRTRADLGISDEFMFLFSFDFFSVFERKNPVAVVEAFKRAFAPGEGPQLVVKSMNGDRYRGELARLKTAASGRDDVRIVDEYWSQDEKDALIAACDCYVSLHRAEGYGLGLAESMARGKPVIATAYSGNLDFMNDDVAHLIPYRVVAAPEGCAPYPAGAPWAEPDLDAAAAAMRAVYENQEDARSLGERARSHVLGTFTRERTGQFVRDRLEERIRLGVVEKQTELADWLAAVVGTALDRVEADVEAADVLRSAPTRYGVGMRALRRFLYRALWPYLFRDRAMNVALLEALRGLERGQARQEAQLEQLAAAVRRLESSAD